MNEHVKRLADRAGFMFWGDEDWRPQGAEIDWSAQYDQEFDAYTQALICEVVNLERSGTDALEYFGVSATGRETVEVEFSDEEFLTYARLAHDRDITLNRFIEEALIQFIEQHERSQSCE